MWRTERFLGLNSYGLVAALFPIRGTSSLDVHVPVHETSTCTIVLVAVNGTTTSSTVDEIYDEETEASVSSSVIQPELNLV